MRICDLTPQEVRAYFESRGIKFYGDSVKQVTRCPFHQDKRPSLSVEISKGIWKCFSGCGEGGLIAFEQKFSAHTDVQKALKSIFESAGQKWESPTGNEEEPEAVYSYTDERGKLMFQKLRYPGKRFVQRRISEKGMWDYSLKGVTKPLYRLPEVITANQVVIVEGEKDADNVSRLELSELDKTGWSRIAATTNFDGASSWDAHHARYFSGKAVAIFPDLDLVGMRHAQLVAGSVHPYAVAVRVVELPGLKAHGDVSDYLQDHSALQLIEEIQKAPLWQPSKSRLLVSAEEFLAQQDIEIDWIVDGVIQRGANGFIVGTPKAGKSFAAMAMAIGIALGKAWMGFEILRRWKVGFISREDNPPLTRWRMRKIIAGYGAREEDLSGRFYINSRDQSPQFKLDIPEQFNEMIAALKQLSPDIVFLDVLNVLHSSDENDNTEMRKVMDRADVMRQELGCSIAVIHHFNKEKDGRLTERIRGASAMAGWVEWGIGIHKDKENDDEDLLRRVEFDLKAASPPANRYFRIQGYDYAGTKTPRGCDPSKIAEMKIDREEPPAKEGGKRGKAS